MRYLILTFAQIMAMTPVVDSRINSLTEKHLAITPVMIKDSTYVIGEDMLNDVNYLEIKHALDSVHALDHVTIRVVNDSEFIRTKLPN